MRRGYLLIGVLPLFLAACSTFDESGTIAQLRNRQIDMSEVEITDGLDRAMESYQRFLQEADGSGMAPEAIRRLADLKVEKEYGLITPGAGETARTEATPEIAAPKAQAREQVDMPAPESASRQVLPVEPQPETAVAQSGESDAAFEQRTTDLSTPLAPPTTDDENLPIDDLERAGPREAIALYQRLLDEYPLYQRNDQVLYQMSRAYEELGQIEEAMKVMDRLVREYPQSRYFDEVQFRRAENFFTRRQYLDAEEAYASIVDIGVGSFYYQLAVYKLGWTFYKQELYEDALHRFIALLDYKVSTGYDFEQTEDEPERKRVEDTFRVISLGFSYLGGAESLVDYFTTYGQRGYEDSIYNNLAEYYYDKRRYSDAVDTYSAFVERNPYHRKSPLFYRRVIEINTAGGFPTLVIETKKTYATKYGLSAEYWQYFAPEDRPEVVEYLKTTLTDLANHYHALYQNPKKKEEKSANFEEALHWYREFIASFPQQPETPSINYQLADLLLENRSFAAAATEYEKTAYQYKRHEQSAKAGYAAVYSYRQYLKEVAEEERLPVREETVRSSLQFAETFPEHEKAAVVLGAAADDLYDMAEHERALNAGQKLIDNFPSAETDVLRSAWLVVAHSSYELELYPEAEAGYLKVLELLPADDETRAGLFDNLAASIYRQGELANAAGEFAVAADHFLRVGILAPTSQIRPTAEYDAAAALIKVKDWTRAAMVLTAFRENFPEHEYQTDVTKKMAFVYREDGKLALAAEEYERIEREAEDDDIRREALLTAAELYEKVADDERTLDVYRRYVGYFPEPFEVHIETRNKIALLLKKQESTEEYLAELKTIIALDAAAGEGRTDRTRYLAAKGALVLAELDYQRFAAVELVQPFKTNLQKKQKLMKVATQEFGKLFDYEVGEVAAAATYYLAEIYADFSRALMQSERPEGLTPMELEDYELAIEEQAYPFEERAISVHESNLELMARGVYNEWIDKSLARLAKFLPARYAKPEEASPIVESLDGFSYQFSVPLPAAETTAEEIPQETADDSSVPATEAAADIAVETAETVETVETATGSDADNSETGIVEEGVSNVEIQ